MKLTIKDWLLTKTPLSSKHKKDIITMSKYLSLSQLDDVVLLLKTKRVGVVHTSLGISVIQEGAFLQLQVIHNDIGVNAIVRDFNEIIQEKIIIELYKKFVPHAKSKILSYIAASQDNLNDVKIAVLLSTLCDDAKILLVADPEINCKSIADAAKVLFDKQTFVHVLPDANRFAGRSASVIKQQLPANFEKYDLVFIKRRGQEEPSKGFKIQQKDAEFIRGYLRFVWEKNIEWDDTLDVSINEFRNSHHSPMNVVSVPSFESIKKLCIGHARLEYRSVVTKKDFDQVASIIESSQRVDDILRP